MQRELSLIEETPNDGVSRTMLLSEADTNNAVAVMLLQLPPYSTAPPDDNFAAYAEHCHVLHGMLAVTQAGRTITLHAGASSHAGAGSPHTCWNPTAAPALALLIYTARPAYER